MGVRRDLFGRNPHQVPITDFFGSVRPVEVISNVTLIPLVTSKAKLQSVPQPKKYRYIPPLVNFNSIV